MREFKLNSITKTVDLDNSETYNKLPKNADELRSLMFKEIGYTYCYMNYWYKDVFGTPRDGGQKERVENLIKYFTENEKSNRTNIRWLQEQVFIFQEETENLI